jgi:hypothetical protein
VETGRFIQNSSGIHPEFIAECFIF